MKALISKPVNDTQQRFNELCVKGGGPSGGPARTKVLELLREKRTGAERLRLQGNRHAL
jgi:hypothetical protein